MISRLVFFVLHLFHSIVSCRLPKKYFNCLARIFVCSTPSNRIEDFFKNMDNIVIGSRFVKGGGYKGVKNLNSSLFEAAKNVRNSNDSVFGMIFSMYFKKFLVFLFNSEVKDLTRGFIVGKKTLFQKKISERSNYGDYFVYPVADLIKSNINIKEIAYICETRMYGESKTASSIFQLFRRGIPYITAAYNCRREF